MDVCLPLCYISSVLGVTVEILGTVTVLSFLLSLDVSYSEPWLVPFNFILEELSSLW